MDMQGLSNADVPHSTPRRSLSPARRLLGYAWPYRRAFLLGFVCVVLTSAFALVSPWVLKHAVDDFLEGVTAGKVRLYAVLLLALSAVTGLFRFLMRRIIIDASRDLEYDLRNAFFAHLQRLDRAWFERHQTGDLMSRATSDLGAVRQMVGPAVMYTSNTAITFVAAIALMVSIDAKLACIALVPLPLVSLTVRYSGRAIHQRFERLQAQLSEISAVTHESLAGVRVVRAYAREAFEIDRFGEANEEYVRRGLRLIRLQGMFFPGMTLLMGIGALLVLWQGGREVIAGRMTVGALVAFNAYLLMLAWPMMAFGYVTNLLQRGMASWKRLLDVLDAAPAIADAPDAVTPEVVRGEIELRGLTFAYGDHVVLHDVSALMPAGSTTAIVGATGSGKSTILHLIARLHDPPPGTVLIDDVDVRQMTLQSLRGAIGMVSQEPFLFSATVADNVAFGVPAERATPEAVARAAAIARLDADVDAFPLAYDTMVSERGITLSGGQKQRAALARALMTEPRILALDDALSAVDTYTEEQILTRLSPFMRGRTSIIVSHRISTVRHADQILVLDEGRIVERGTHDALVEAGGAYAALHRRQLLEEELAAS